MSSTAEVLLDGGTFFEAPRWHGGRWWVSDFFSHTVFSLEADGTDVKEEVVVSEQPSGLGWAPDGSLLVVSMLDRRLLRRESASRATDEVADLSEIAGGPCNDMVVDSVGRAWVGNFGFDHFNDGEFATANLARVDPDGSVSVAASDLSFPNGMVITDDGCTLLVGETFASRYTAFRIADDCDSRQSADMGRATWSIPRRLLSRRRGATLGCGRSWTVLPARRGRWEHRRACSDSRRTARLRLHARRSGRYGAVDVLCAGLRRAQACERC